MTQLADLVDSLKREIAVPGEYDTKFPKTSDDDLAATLADAFGQAQLDGWFGKSVIDVNAGTVTPDLSAAGAALVTTYSAIRILRSRFRDLQTTTRYQAGDVHYETQFSANVLSGEIKSFEDRIKDIKALALRALRGTNAVHVADAYLVKAFGYYPYAYYGEFGGFFGWEIAGLTMGGFFGNV